MTTVSTEDRIEEMQERLLEPGLTRAQIEKIEKIISVLRGED